MADEFARAIGAMADVQRRSVEAAGALVERLVASVDGHHAEPSDAAPSEADDGLAGFAKLWRDSMTSLASAVNGGRAPHIDVAAIGTSTPIAITVDATTMTASTEVWIHNPTNAGLDKLRVHCGAPQAHDGATLDALSFIADPDAFDLPARSSRGVEITVCAPDASPGVYRTLLLVEGLPDQWLPIEIRVPES